jgi:hypothetical protein
MTLVIVSVTCTRALTQPVELTASAQALFVPAFVAEGACEVMLPVWVVNHLSVLPVEDAVAVFGVPS